MRTLRPLDAGGGGAPFDPLTLNPQFWFKADAGVLDGVGSPATLDGTPVGTWRDQSGFNRHATQATVAKQPTLKLAIQNGKPIIRGDAVDDIMQTIGTTIGTIFTICGAFTMRTGQFGYLFSSVPNLGVALLQNPPFYMYANFMGPADAALTYGQFHAYSLLYTGDSTSRLYRNGVQQGGQAFPGPASLSGISLFNANDFSGPASADIGELLVFPGVLANSDRMKVESYLKERWGTP